jgi:hypothetical protein
MSKHPLAHPASACQAYVLLALQVGICANLIRLLVLVAHALPPLAQLLADLADAHVLVVACADATPLSCYSSKQRAAIGLQFQSIAQILA